MDEVKTGYIIAALDQAVPKAEPIPQIFSSERLSCSGNWNQVFLHAKRPKVSQGSGLDEGTTDSQGISRLWVVVEKRGDQGRQRRLSVPQAGFPEKQTPRRLMGVLPGSPPTGEGNKGPCAEIT